MQRPQRRCVPFGSEETLRPSTSDSTSSGTSWASSLQSKNRDVIRTRAPAGGRRLLCDLTQSRCRKREATLRVVPPTDGAQL
jgi:hypothetical protein